MHSERLLDHFRQPRNVGELSPPAVTVDVSNPACGDTMRLSVRWDNGRVSEVRYLVRGCTASVAAGSALTELLAGRDREGAGSLKPADIAFALDGLPPESTHAAALCIDAVRAVLKASANLPKT